MKKNKLKKDIIEFMGVLSMVFSLLFLSMWVVYYIVENYVDVDSIFGGAIGEKKVYILKNTNNEKYIPYLKKVLKHEYSIVVVKSDLLQKKKKGVLFLIDCKNLTKNQINSIVKFVANGGSIIFNNSNDELIKTITDLKKIDILPHNQYYVQTPLLSVFKIDKQKISLYDDIYLYDKEALLDFTKDKVSYGVMWNGNYAKGSWLYFSFPFYIFQNNDLKFTEKKLQIFSQKKIRMLIDMINFSYYGYKVVKFPYIDTDKMVLIDEYMDYKYDDSFIKYIEKNNLKATIFINPDIVNHTIKANPNNIEIASMSDTNKWKLAKYSNQKIIGFSNENYLKPDIDKLYNKYGFKYMLTDLFSNDIYYDDFVVLNYKGFNDITLKDDIKDIKQSINFYSRYNIYTFSIHSYILGQKANFKILDEVINEFKKYPLFTAKEIAQRYKDTTKISMSTMLTPSSLAVKIVNDTLKEMKNVTFRVYSKYKFDRIESNFFNIKAYIIKETPEYIDVRVEKMNKNIEFYLRFKK